MRTNVKTTHYEVTPQETAYLTEKLTAIERLVQNDDAAQCDIELGREQEGQQHGDVYRAECNLTTKGKLFRAVAVAESMSAAIDNMKSEISQQLRRHGDKKHSLFRRGGIQVKRWLRFGTEGDE